HPRRRRGAAQRASCALRRSPPNAGQRAVADRRQRPGENVMPHARTAAKPRRRSEGGFLLGMFVGVVLGLAVALGIAFNLNKSPMPFQTAKPTKSDKDAGKTPVITGLPSSSAPAIAAADKPKFDFYSILPKEEPVSEK